MPELFIELFSEEIPARMQARAADDLCRLLGEALSPLAPVDMRGFSGPRRIAAVATVAAGVAESRSVERGPRRTAPEQALAGFLRKHGAARDDLREEGDFWVLDRMVPGVAAAGLVAAVMPGLLRRFAWPKSMRWGGTSGFTWVRPLRRIVASSTARWFRSTCATGRMTGMGWRRATSPRGIGFSRQAALPLPPARNGRRNCGRGAWWWRPAIGGG